jgi:paraquat-inducible protein A
MFSKFSDTQRLFALLVVWGGASVLLIAGLVLPVFTFSKFYFFDDTFSLLGGIGHMFSEGEWLLGVVILLFSVLFPLFKLVIQMVLIFEKSDMSKRWLTFLHYSGKWSMLDVFVVAILLSSIKIGAIAEVTVHAGLYCFTMAVIASMMLSMMIKYLGNKN